MSHLGHSLIGDPLYGISTKQKIKEFVKIHQKVSAALSEVSRQALHSINLSLMHPVSKEHIHFSSEIPADLRSLYSLVF